MQRQQAAQSAGIQDLKLEYDGTSGNTQPVAMSTEGNSSRGILSFLNNGSGVAPAIKAAMHCILEQGQPSDSAAPTAEGQQISDQEAPLLEGTACLVWLPDGQMTGSTPPSVTTHHPFRRSSSGSACFAGETHVVGTCPWPAYL